MALDIPGLILGIAVAASMGDPSGVVMGLLAGPTTALWVGPLRFLASLIVKIPLVGWGWGFGLALCYFLLVKPVEILAVNRGWVVFE